MYIATKGGEAAIQHAESLYHQLKGQITLEAVQQIEATMPYLLDRVMGEASLYAPELAALAVAQSGGDLYEAVLLLRAFRSTQPRIAYAQPVTPERMVTVRRISAAFKDIPGGQVLGPTLDYSHRILRLDILDSSVDAHGVAPEVSPEVEAELPETPAEAVYPLLADWQRQNGLLQPLPNSTLVQPADIPDVTRDPIMIPAPRAHRLQALARADTGGVLALGYSSMRGYGLIHPTVNELRLAHAEVIVQHPVTGASFSAGRVRVSQAEVVSKDSAGFQIGFAATLGWNEIKLIAASTLDMEMNNANSHPALSEDFVLYHTEPVESSGFCIHFKLPHYVTFASSMDAVRKVQALYGGAKATQTEAEEELSP